VASDHPKRQPPDVIEELLRQLARAPPAPFGPDAVLKAGGTPRFKVLKLLGKGSFGAVWLVPEE